MGALCSKGSAVDKSPSDTFNIDGLTVPAPMSKAQATLAAQRADEAMEKQRLDPSFPASEQTVQASGSSPASAAESSEPRLSRALSQKSGSNRPETGPSMKTGTKVSEVSSMLGRASTVGLGKAVDVLDTLGSSMTSLNLSGGFVSGTTTKGTQIRILAFEVANTIVKGSNLMRSLSKDNIKHLKGAVLTSEGVLHLISKDMDELLKIVASDKRSELRVFSKEVVRFGNRCKDPQWHHLDRYFDKLASERTPRIQQKEVELVMQNLMASAQYTAELYHELHALDRFEQDYRRKNGEERSPNVVQRGDNLQLLKQELKSQRKHVKSLKKRSLWSKNLEEVMEKLVDIVHFLHLEINGAFGSANREEPQNVSTNNSVKLGPAGLALHYANIITQIDTLVSRSSSVPQNVRETLYQALPPDVKSALRSRLRSFEIKEELTVSQIKAEMEKTLQWLVPFANNTTKAHHGFGWVGEWANIGSEVNRKPAGPADLLRIETLHHAAKGKTEAHILNLVVWLQHLISQSKPANGSVRSPIKSPVRSPTQKGLPGTPTTSSTSSSLPVLTQEDREMLKDVKFKRLIPGISKSQEFDVAGHGLGKHDRFSKSNSHSPTSSWKDLFSTRRPPSMLPAIDFDIDPSKALDVIDRVDFLRKL